MDGNNGIDPDTHGDVDPGVGTLPVWDFVLDPIAPPYRGHLLLGDAYKHAISRTNWDKLVADLDLERYPDLRIPERYAEPDPLRNFFTDFAAKPNWDIFPVSDADPISDGKPEPVFIDNSFHNTDAIFNRDSLTYAIIKRHLEAAYAEVAATLLGAASDDSEGNADAETKAAPEAGVAFDCWS